MPRALRLSEAREHVSEIMMACIRPDASGTASLRDLVSPPARELGTHDNICPGLTIGRLSQEPTLEMKPLTRVSTSLFNRAARDASVRYAILPSGLREPSPRERRNPTRGRRDGYQRPNTAYSGECHRASLSCDPSARRRLAVQRSEAKRISSQLPRVRPSHLRTRDHSCPGGRARTDAPIATVIILNEKSLHPA
jgi:hypothetical protein